MVSIKHISNLLNPYLKVPFVQGAAFFCTAVILIGCASNGTVAGNSLDNETPKEKTQTTALKKRAGVWQVADCKVKAERAGVTLKTDGNISHQTMRVMAKLTEEAANVPQISIVGMGGIDIELNGRGQFWSFELPNTPYANARMIGDKMFIVLEYTPKANAYTPAPRSKKIVFPTLGLPQALIDMYAECED